MLKRLWCRLFGHKRFTCIVLTDLLFEHTCPRCGKKFHQEFKSYYIPVQDSTSLDAVKVNIDSWTEVK
jgi:hypothetical protein